MRHPRPPCTAETAAQGKLTAARRAQQGPGYPPVDERLWGYFSAVAGPENCIDADKLQRALTTSGFAGYTNHEFSLETCRLMISLLDRDNSGTLNFTEFQSLWSALHMWRDTFHRFDRDRSGRINPVELSQAIQSYGYNISQAVGNTILKRYSRHGLINFDDFIAVSVKVRALSEAFRRHDPSGQGYATLSYDDVRIGRRCAPRLGRADGEGRSGRPDAVWCAPAHGGRAAAMQFMRLTMGV